MSFNRSVISDVPDVLDENYPVEYLSEAVAQKRQAMIDKVMTYGKRVERYSEAKVKEVWTDIFVHNLSDRDVAAKHGCTIKYAFNLRHDRARRKLTARIRAEYFDGLRMEAEAVGCCNSDSLGAEGDTEKQISPNPEYDL